MAQGHGREHHGRLLCARAVADTMKEQAFGRIINISSDSVHRGTKNYLHYVTSKSALIGMSNSLARELGPHGITVNCIRPGTVETEVEERMASFTPEVRQRNIDLQCIPRTVVPSDLVGLVNVPDHAGGLIHHWPDHRLRRWLHAQLLTGELRGECDHGTLRKNLHRRRVGRAGSNGSSGSSSTPPLKRHSRQSPTAAARKMSTRLLLPRDEPSRRIPGPLSISGST